MLKRAVITAKTVFPRVENMFSPCSSSAPTIDKYKKSRNESFNRTEDKTKNSDKQ